MTAKLKLKKGDRFFVGDQEYEIDLDGVPVEADDRTPMERKLDALEARIEALENKGWYYPWTWTTPGGTYTVPDPPAWPQPGDPTPDGPTWYTSCETPNIDAGNPREVDF